MWGHVRYMWARGYEESLGPSRQGGRLKWAGADLPAWAVGLKLRLPSTWRCWIWGGIGVLHGV